MKKQNWKDKIEKIKKVDKKVWVISLALPILLFILFAANFYFGVSTRRISDPIFKFIPVPVALVEKTDFIFSKDLLNDTQAVKNFYQTQDFSSLGMRVDFKTEEGKMRLKIKEKEILDKLVEDTIVMKIAQEKGLGVTKKESEKELAEKISLAGVEPMDFALNVRKLYNWSLEDFRREIVYPQLHMKKLFDYYQENLQEEADAYKKIKDAEAKISEDNSNFEELAKEYSQGGSAENSGELGWFQKDQLIPEVAEKAFALEAGKRSGVITSSLGFHIILVDERRKIKNEDGSELEEVKLKQIFTRDGGFLDWLVNKKKEAHVSILMKDYVWNSETAQVDFRDESMKKAEENIRAKSEGDPSM